MDRETLFGNDMRLVDQAGGADLIANPNGDLALAEGNDNIVQALSLRLRVRKGELTAIGWPDYGSRLHELIGGPNNARTHVILMTHARQAIEKDPRVEEVKDIYTRVLPGEFNVIRLVMEIQLITASNPLNFVFDMNLEQS
jgi:phage baseplate assembly protein W